MKHILITGGSGMVGRRITDLLLTKGYQVSWLSRSGKSIDDVTGYKWNLEAMTIDSDAFESVDSIIHLAGEGVANHRWTTAQKKKISDSRILSTKLLYQELERSNHKIASFISASGSGYYGVDNGPQLLKEEDSPADDFLSKVTQQWEDEVDQIHDYAANVAKLRFGVILSKEGGALEKMMLPIKWKIGASLGYGNQYMSWIHIDDICHLILYSLENSLSGAYNAVTPNPVTNREMTEAIAKQFRTSIYLPNVPSFILRLLLGEMSTMVLGSNKVSSEKIENEGFKFKFPALDPALENLLR